MSSIHLGVYPYHIFLKRTRPRFTPSDFDRYYLIKRSAETLDRAMSHDRNYLEKHSFKDALHVRRPYWYTNYYQLLRDTDTYTARVYREYLHKKMHSDKEAELSYSHWYSSSRKNRRSDIKDSLEALRKYGMISYWHSVKTYDILDIALGVNPVIKKVIKVFYFNRHNRKNVNISYLISGVALVIAMLIMLLMSVFRPVAVIMFFVAVIAAFNGYSDSEQIKMSNRAMLAVIDFVSNGIENVHVISRIKPKDMKGSPLHAKKAQKHVQKKQKASSKKEAGR